MLWTVINELDIFYTGCECTAEQSIRSSNPFDYIRNGYYLDNAALYGGKNNVDYNINIPGAVSGADVDFSDIGKRTFGNISRPVG